jgi:hypothetical protein
LIHEVRGNSMRRSSRRRRYNAMWFGLGVSLPFWEAMNVIIRPDSAPKA